MDEKTSGPPPDSLVERIKRNDAADQELRRSVNILAGLIQHLPDTEDLFFTDDTQRACRIVRDRHPQLYMGQRASIRQRTSRFFVEVLDSFVGLPSPLPWRDIQLLQVADLMNQAPEEWLIEGLLPRKGYALVIGPSQAAKTFFLLHALSAIARGVLFFGKKTAQGRGLYVAGEGRLKNRLHAEIQYHGLMAEDLNGLRFIENALDLSGPTADRDRLVDLAREFQPQIIVLDTLSRVIGGADENSAQDVARFLASLRVLEEASGALIVCVHHVGKTASRGARGSSALRAAADVEMELEREDDGMRLARVTKLRDDQEGLELAFRLERVEFEDGRSSCIVLPVPHERKPRQAQKHLTPHEQLGLDVLKEQLADSAERLPQTSSIPPGKQGCKVEAWRDRFYARIGEEMESNTRRVAFFRAKNGLVHKKVAGCWRQWVWLW